VCVGVLRYNGATWRSDSPSRSIYHSLAERPNCFGRHSYSFSLLKAIIPGLASSECSVFYNNKCIGDDTKAAARQSPNCILKKQKKNMAKNDFQYGGWNSYTLQCGTIMTLISSGDCTLQCGMWLWNHNSEFTKWQHPAMWQVAVG